MVLWLAQVFSKMNPTHTKKERVKKLGVDGGPATSSLMVKLDDKGM